MTAPQPLRAVERAPSATGASRAAISHHYDVGNDFYALWLDDSMTYSAALWHDDESLSQAQRNKLDWHLDQVRVEQAARLLDVGCGWGSLLSRALERNPSASVLGLTLSEQQWAHGQGRRRAGFDVELRSWQDFVPEQPYDGIVSIGAFEHFARLDQTPEGKLAGYRAFFEFCHRTLRPGGRLSLQTITYEDSDKARFSQFFAQDIFPESDLPHLFEIHQAARGLFEVVLLRNDRAHYAKTLRAWLAALRARREQAEALVGREAFQRYERYLGMMIIAFHTGSTNLARIAFLRRDPPAGRH